MCLGEGTPFHGGRHLCEGGQRLLVARVLMGDSNAEIRAILRDEGHNEPNDAQILTARRSKACKEARIAYFTEMKDYKSVSPATRLKYIADDVEMLRRKMHGLSENAIEAAIEQSEEASEGRRKRQTPGVKEMVEIQKALLLSYREISRMVDVVDPKGEEGITDAGSGAVNIPIGQIADALELAMQREGLVGTEEEEGSAPDVDEDR